MKRLNLDGALKVGAEMNSVFANGAVAHLSATFSPNGEKGLSEGARGATLLAFGIQSSAMDENSCQGVGYIRLLPRIAAYSEQNRPVPFLRLERRGGSVARCRFVAGDFAKLSRRKTCMPERGENKRVNVLGVGLSAINLPLALQAVGRALAQKTKGYVCVTGVHGVMEAQQDPRLRAILNQSFLNTPDGMPMVWIGRLNGHREMDRVYGPDLMLLVCEFARDNGYSHFLYGGGEGVAQELKQSLEKKFPGIKIAGTYTPPFRPLTESEEAELIRRVNALKPDIIWVGLSTPKQEKFMAQYRDKFDTTLLFGVGAAFDFHAGRVRQAPRWMQRSGLEWFFRLCCEPRRLWRRYLRNNPLFAFRFFCQWTGLKKYTLE